MISPADDPNYAILKKDHCIIALDKDADTPPLTIEIPVKDQLKFGTVIVGPNGTNIRYTSVAGSHEQKERHDPIFSLSRLSDAEWVHGRAGMSYRALNGSNSELSSASQIRIKGSGTVPDWVHYHDVSFQTLFSSTGQQHWCMRIRANLSFLQKGTAYCNHRVSATKFWNHLMTLK